MGEEDGKWHDCPCTDLCAGSSRLPFVCRIDEAIAAEDPEEGCVESPAAAFTCSDSPFESCCPGTEMGDRCGDCCVNYLLFGGVLFGIIVVCVIGGICCCRLNK